MHDLVVTWGPKNLSGEATCVDSLPFSNSPTESSTTKFTIQVHEASIVVPLPTHTSFTLVFRTGQSLVLVTFFFFLDYYKTEHFGSEDFEMGFKRLNKYSVLCMPPLPIGEGGTQIIAIHSLVASSNLFSLWGRRQIQTNSAVAALVAWKVNLRCQANQVPTVVKWRLTEDRSKSILVRRAVSTGTRGMGKWTEPIWSLELSSWLRPSSQSLRCSLPCLLAGTRDQSVHVRYHSSSTQCRF